MRVQTTCFAVAATLFGAALATLTAPAAADAITDWNERSSQIIGAARIGTPPAVRVMALVQTAAYAAAREAAALPGATSQALDTAVAAAHRTALTTLLPAQRAAVDAAYQSTLANLTDDALRVRHVAIGESAAMRVLADRNGDTPAGAESHRPHTTAGTYVPTVSPAATSWSTRRPWLLERADQFRPGKPPGLTSERWAGDYNEIKALGARDSTQRSVEQTEMARFWDYSLPAIYYGVVRSVALQPGRDLLANARLYAVVSQAMDDALIAVFDAKYSHNLWRPITALRNGDVDGHDGTERDPSWVPLIETPLHPEYPCAHCTLAGSVAAVLKAEARERPLPTLSTTSPTAKGAIRRWNNLDDFVQEVALARIYGGVHYRQSTEAGLILGQRVGEWALARSAANLL